VESGFRSIIIFLTVCTKARRPLLANDAAATLIVQAWSAANFWIVGRYVILPDHIHLFCAPNMLPPQPLKNRISSWKNHVTRKWPKREEIPIWQTEYWIANSDVANRTTKSGTTSKIIRCGMGM
jgi:REP element-mobilizing transposase RayT